MSKEKLITLANDLGFIEEYEYLAYCVECYSNEMFDYCIELFFAMKRSDQKKLLSHIKENYLSSTWRNNLLQFYTNLFDSL